MAKDNNLTDFLTDIATVIRAKKGTSGLINPQDFSDEIARLGIDGDIAPFFWDWSQIGYTHENTILQQQFEDAIAHSKSLAENYTPTNIDYIFRDDKKLKFAPFIDTSNAKSMQSVFSGCSSLVAIPELDTSNATNIQAMFYNCHALSTIPHLNTSKVTNFTHTFYACYSLVAIPELDTSNAISMSSIFQSCESLTIVPKLNTSKVTSMGQAFSRCYNLTTIVELDMTSVTFINSVFLHSSNLTFIFIKNVGKSTLTTYDFAGATNWGKGSDENRQSLIDSLITYSYDRAANGMDAATIELSTTTKALLTEGEIAQITAKGFTIA